MAVNHLTITNNYSNGASNLSFNPADYYVQGLSTECSITFVAYNYEYPFGINLHDSSGGFIASYYIQNGETVALKSAFPGISLEGKYLTSSFLA